MLFSIASFIKEEGDRNNARHPPQGEAPDKWGHRVGNVLSSSKKRTTE